MSWMIFVFQNLLEHDISNEEIFTYNTPQINIWVSGCRAQAQIEHKFASFVTYKISCLS